MCKVTVYIPCYNYARFIETAVQSVFKQTMQDWELIIINDGSTDNTKEILNQYHSNSKVRVLNQENKGLNITNNIALRLSNGKYIIRLDADDYLDENALLVMSSILDTKPEIGLVYPDYYYIDEKGEVIELVRRKKIDEEVQMLDLPAHGACTMFRKDLLLQIGGYVEEFSCQDGYELWLRFIQKHSVYNVNTPLFYYRQHPESLTSNMNKILETRRKIKRRFVEKEMNVPIPKVLGIIPVVRRSLYLQADPFAKLAGKPLIWYSVNDAYRSKSLDRIILSSEDDEVLDYGSQFPRIETLKRDANWAKSNFKIHDFIAYILDRLKESEGYEPDAVCTLYITTPLRRYYHVDKSIDTMTIFDVDSVVSVQEELAHCYYHRKFGLEHLNTTRGNLRVERQAIYKENSSIFLSKVDVIRNGRFLGDKIGHIIMLPEESIKINSKYEHWLAEKILIEWQNNEEV